MGHLNEVLLFTVCCSIAAELLWTPFRIFYTIQYAKKILRFYRHSVDRADAVRVRSAKDDRHE